MRNETRVAYDSLADSYHLIYSDWHKSVVRQGKTLDSVIRKERRSTSRTTVLDCSCGIGTQAIGLTLMGYQVHATDLSPKSIEQARRNAQRVQAHLTFGTADFRALAGKVKGRFDVVLSCDNSLPHLLTEKDVLLAAKNMKAKLNPKGICVVGIRDYNGILNRRPKGVAPVLMVNNR